MESGERLRVDATVTETHILAPSDSGLLYDAVRVMVRLLKRSRDYDPAVTFNNHQRLAKRRRHAIMNARTNARRRPLYEELLKRNNFV